MIRPDDAYNPCSISAIDTDEGASMVEYALLVLLIAMIAFAAVALMGNELSSTYSNIADSVGNPP